MALLSKILQGDGSWRLKDEQTGELVGRVWATTHVDRFLRDADLAEAIAPVLEAPRTTRRTAAVTAFTTWTTAGGRSVDLSTLAQSVPGDGNTHLLIGGADAGYIHGEVYNTARMLRFTALAEEVFAAQSLGTSGARNTATDAALDRFAAGGGITRT